MVQGQMNLYDYFGKEQDPLYLNILNLKKNSTVVVGNIEITLNNFGIYEIKTEDIHESKSCIEDCYELIRVIGLYGEKTERNNLSK